MAGKLNNLRRMKMEIYKKSIVFMALSLHLTWATAITLPTTLDEAQSLERADALPPTGLYSQHYDLVHGKPGDLLAQEPFDGYQVAGLGRALRIAYQSQDASNRA